MSIFSDMSANDFDAQIRAKAYQLFHSELLNHLSKARLAFDGDRHNNPSDYQEIGKSFHTVRGGAGFFGLEDLEALAGRVEDLLLESVSHTKENLFEAREVIRDIEELVSRIPKP